MKVQNPGKPDLKPLRIKFIKSAASLADYPDLGGLPEIAMLGRSNVGKSSLINSWAKSSVAKVSQTPGKTGLLNFYDVNGQYIIVDMPGYGYAKVSETQRRSWKKMVSEYFKMRQELRGAVVVIDVRRDWEAPEHEVQEWLDEIGIDWCVGISKVDKLNRKDFDSRKKYFKTLLLNHPPHFFSSETGSGTRELENWFFKSWLVKGEVEE
jgi:GTP-binding protein